MEWTVVTVLVTLIGLFMTIGKPIINLQKCITKLQDSVDGLSRRLDKYEQKTDKQDEILQDHETRITVLEQKQRLGVFVTPSAILFKKT